MQAGRFREDLWARLNTWTFFLPNLKDRIEDIAPNVEFELQRFAANHQRQLRFQRDALDNLKFVKSREASWQNFRDLTASVTRSTALSSGRVNPLRNGGKGNSTFEAAVVDSSHTKPL